MASDLYIIAAGKGSRMNSAIPKALVPITDEPCLTTTLQQIGHKFRYVFIVANVDVRNLWDEYFDELRVKYHELARNVIPLYISSGLGDGHATMSGFKAALKWANKEDWGLEEDVVVAWGDVFFPRSEIIDELLSAEMVGSGLLPAVLEENPYVTLTTVPGPNGSNLCTGADFSKYGEKHERGLHDQSVFRLKLYVVLDVLKRLDKAFWKNGKYLTPGGELSLLHSFHYLYNTRKPARVYETKYPTLSFNTIEEVFAIQQEIDNKWKNRNRS